MLQLRQTGHLSKDCRQSPQRGGKGGKGKTKGQGKGKNNQNQKSDNVVCYKCGGHGHVSKGCGNNEKFVSGLEETTPAAKPAEATPDIGGLFINALRLDALDLMRRRHRILRGLGFEENVVGKIMALENGSRKLVLGIDSGAAVTVVLENFARDSSVHENNERVKNGGYVPDRLWRMGARQRHPTLRRNDDGDDDGGRREEGCQGTRLWSDESVGVGRRAHRREAHRDHRLEPQLHDRQEVR